MQTAARTAQAEIFWPTKSCQFEKKKCALYFYKSYLRIQRFYFSIILAEKYKFLRDSGFILFLTHVDFDLLLEFEFSFK